MIFYDLQPHPNTKKINSPQKPQSDRLLLLRQQTTRHKLSGDTVVSPDNLCLVAGDSIGVILIPNSLYT